MAYKKRSGKKKSKTTRRRRRVSGIGSAKNSLLLMGGAAVAGYLLGPKINDKITEALGTSGATIDPKLIAGAEVLLGFVLPKYLLKNSLPGKILGGLMIGAGAHMAAKEYGIVSGFSDYRSVAGYKDMKAIAGAPIPAASGSSLSALQVISGIS